MPYFKPSTHRWSKVRAMAVARRWLEGGGRIGTQRRDHLVAREPAGIIELVLVDASAILARAAQAPIIREGGRARAGW